MSKSFETAVVPEPPLQNGIVLRWFLDVLAIVVSSAQLGLLDTSFLLGERFSRILVAGCHSTSVSAIVICVVHMLKKKNWNVNPIGTCRAWPFCCGCSTFNGIISIEWAAAVVVGAAFNRSRLRYVFFGVDRLRQCWVLVWAMATGEWPGFSQVIRRWFVSRGLGPNATGGFENFRGNGRICLYCLSSVIGYRRR